MPNYFLEEEFSVIFITCPTSEEARTIARVLVEERLAACVSVMPDNFSIYQWHNEFFEHTEAKLMIKTRSALFEKISERVKELHSFVVPEIIELRITNASKEYKMWLSDETDIA